MLVSVFIISFSLVAIFNLNSKYTQQTKQEKEAFVATLLAQEGVEIVKNMRDTNWVTSKCWYEGIAKTSTVCTTPADCCTGGSSLATSCVYDCLGNTPPDPLDETCLYTKPGSSYNGCEVDYLGRGGDGSTPSPLRLTDWGSAFSEVDSDPSNGNYLYLDSNGFYGYNKTGATWTPYRRRILVTMLSPYNLNVRVIVYWNKKKVEVVQKIMDWRNHNLN